MRVPLLVSSLLSALACTLGYEDITHEYMIQVRRPSAVPHIEALFASGLPSSLDARARLIKTVNINDEFVALRADIFNPRLVELLQEHKEVVRVVQNSFVELYATQTNPPNWGIDRMDQRELPLNQLYRYSDRAGEGVDAYIIDTGINLNHVEFENGNVVWGTTTPRNSEDIDLNGHGSHVASTVCGSKTGVAKKAKCIAVKVMKDSGLGTVFDITDGVSWVAEAHKNGTSKRSVANMSLGSPISNPIIDASVKALAGAGVVVVVAAGNSDRDACTGSPGGQPDMITVGASDENDVRASFSNWGSCVDIFAPGVNITGAWWDSNTEFFVASGTSMASPHVAGLAALILAEKNVGFGQEDMRNELVKMASSGLLKDIGVGSPNLLAFTNPPAASVYY